MKKKLSSASVDTESLRINLAASTRIIHDIHHEWYQQSVVISQLKTDIYATQKKLDDQAEICQLLLRSSFQRPCLTFFR